MPLPFQSSGQLLPPPGQAGRKAISLGAASALGSSKRVASPDQSWCVLTQNNFGSLFCLLICLGYIAFIIKFTADYRDFAAMKLIYMLPGVLPFALALLEGMQTVIERLRPYKFAERMVHCVLFCLVILHGVGIVALVKQLAER